MTILLSEVYDIVHRDRGEAKNGYVRPTLKELYTTKDFSRVLKNVGYPGYLQGYTEDLCVNGLPTGKAGSTLPEKIFDDAVGGGTDRWTDLNDAPTWVQYKFIQPERINKLRLLAYLHNGAYQPKDFRLLASNTGDFNGEEVEIMSGQYIEALLITDWVDYTFSNTNAYIYYRIAIDTQWNVANVHIDQVEMMQGNGYIKYTDDLCTNSANAIEDSHLSVYVATRAFTNTSSANSTTAWQVNTTLNPDTFIGYNFGVPTKIERYTIKTAITVADVSSIKSWKFQGSNGGNWTTVHEVIDAPLWLNTEKRMYTFSNNTEYLQYRILITGIFGETTAIIDEIEMMEIDKYTENKCYSSFGGTLGTATAAVSTYGSTPAMAFDGSTVSSVTTAWHHGAWDGISPSWIQYQFTESKRIEKINIWSYSYSGHEAVNLFTIKASNTGAFSGEEIDIYNGEHTSTNNFGAYYFDNENSYSYYRLVITKVLPDVATRNPIIQEIEMMERYI